MTDPAVADLTPVADRWPDVAGDFAAIVPGGTVALRTEDAWFARKYAEGSRVRAVDVVPAAGGTTVDALAAAARDRARTAGWRLIHRDDAAGTDVLRRYVRQLVKRVPQFLRIAPVTVDVGGAAVCAVRIDIETGWVRHRLGAIVGRRMIHELVRATWGIGDPERRVAVEVIRDPGDLAEDRIVRETMELPPRHDWRDRFAAHGLAPVDGDERRWLRRDRFTKGVLTTAAALRDDGAAIVSVELDRAQRLR